MDGVNLLSVWMSVKRMVFLLEEKCSHAANFTLLFYKDLKVLVDDGHSQEDSSTRSDGTQEVCHDRQPSYTKASKCSSCGDVSTKEQTHSGPQTEIQKCELFDSISRFAWLPVKFVYHRGFSVPSHYHLLLLQLLCHLRQRDITEHLQYWTKDKLYAIKENHTYIFGRGS